MISGLISKLHQFLAGFANRNDVENHTLFQYQVSMSFRGSFMGVKIAEMIPTGVGDVPDKLLEAPLTDTIKPDHWKVDRRPCLTRLLLCDSSLVSPS